MLAKNAKTARGVMQPSSSLTTIASKLAPTGCRRRTRRDLPGFWVSVNVASVAALLDQLVDLFNSEHFVEYVIHP